MTGGPWTQSMKVVHGPGPKWGSMDPWSTFCPHPFTSVLSVLWQLHEFHLYNTLILNMKTVTLVCSEDVIKL